MGSLDITPIPIPNCTQHLPLPNTALLSRLPIITLALPFGTQNTPITPHQRLPFTQSTTSGEHDRFRFRPPQMLLILLSTLIQIKRSPLLLLLKQLPLLPSLLLLFLFARDSPLRIHSTSL